jgi:hypothetical protein
LHDHRKKLRENPPQRGCRHRRPFVTEA